MENFCCAPTLEYDTVLIKKANVKWEEKVESKLFLQLLDGRSYKVFHLVCLAEGDLKECFGVPGSHHIL